VDGRESIELGLSRFWERSTSSPGEVIKAEDIFDYTRSRLNDRSFAKRFGGGDGEPARQVLAQGNSTFAEAAGRDLARLLGEQQEYRGPSLEAAARPAPCRNGSASSPFRFSVSPRRAPRA